MALRLLTDGSSSFFVFAWLPLSIPVFADSSISHDAGVVIDDEDGGDYYNDGVVVVVSNGGERDAQVATVSPFYANVQVSPFFFTSGATKLAEEMTGLFSLQVEILII
ncbi:hypothetical protein NC651_038712 [Populus alba x Populus x berolinensis]|nr:hypothetical protein NC651_038712 [Populus alba x Populus x berolinensis]